jgi:hypothetical protein
MNTMNHFRMSYLTTPQELMDADLNDREKLFLGLESRTMCCFSLVPTDCVNGTCGHDTHENRESPESLDDEDYVDDGPCAEYQDSHILSHPICPNVRSCNEAKQDSRDAWEKSYEVWEEIHCSWTA